VNGIIIAMNLDPNDIVWRFLTA